MSRVASVIRLTTRASQQAASVHSLSNERAAAV